MIDFIKKHCLLCLVPKRNLLGDVVVGYNRPALNRHEKINVEQANEWLVQDIEKARKEVDKHGLHESELAVFVAFYIGRRRWKEADSLFNLLRDGEKTKAALILTNHRWFANNPSLGVELAKKILKGEKSL
jgi:hypothetical protein